MLARDIKAVADTKKRQELTELYKGHGKRLRAAAEAAAEGDPPPPDDAA